MYLHFKESRTKCGPPGDILQEADFSVILRSDGVSVVAACDDLLPVVWRVRLDQVHGHQLTKHVTIATEWNESDS